MLTLQNKLRVGNDFKILKKKLNIKPISVSEVHIFLSVLDMRMSFATTSEK